MAGGSHYQAMMNRLTGTSQDRTQWQNTTAARSGRGVMTTSGGNPGEASTTASWDNRYSYTPDGGITLKNNTTQPQRPTTSGGGSRRRYGGGGGGGGGSQMNQAMFDALVALMKKSKPADMKFTPQKVNTYEGTGFYDFDPTMFNEALAKIASGTDRDIAANREATANARAQMENYSNPYAGGLRATSEDLSESMAGMLAANQGAGADAAAQVSAEGAQADAAMGNVAALLAAVDERRQQSNMQALNADERSTERYIRDQRAGLEAGVEMARAQAMALYEKEKWQYGEEIARINWQRRNQIIDNNFALKTQTAQQNTTNENAWRTQVLSPIMQLAGMMPAAKVTELKKILGV